MHVCKGVSTFLRQRVLTRRLGGTEKGWKRHFPLFVPGLCPLPWIHSLVVKTPQIWQNCSAAVSFLWPLLWLFSIWNLTDTHFFWPLCHSLLQGTLFVKRPNLCWEHDQIKRKFSFFYCSICIRFTTRPREKLSVFFIKQILLSRVSGELCDDRQVLDCLE